jgi:hypothetical protein
MRRFIFGRDGAEHDVASIAEQGGLGQAVEPPAPTFR